MHLISLGRELVFPAIHGATLIAFSGFFLLIEFALFGRLFGLFLLALVLPALVRYLMLLLDARARGIEPGPPGAELLLWYDDVWSLFPIIHVLVIAYGAYLLGSMFSVVALIAFLLLYVLLLPASLAVLAVSRSPLESLKPPAIAALIRHCRKDYWVAPVYILGSVALLTGLSQQGLSGFVLEMIALYCVFAGFTITGGIVRPYRLHRAVAIAEPLAPAADAVAEKLERRRAQVLERAYGFSSRDNQAGGLQHVYRWLDEDPDPGSAWPWFLEQMLGWESSGPGFAFAQRYLGILLQRADDVAALKLIQRCRLIDDTFAPLPGDRQRAREAAERCQHEELKSLLL